MNNLDPKIQEIERRHAEEQAELDARECGTFVRQEHQDRAYLLSEYKRLQEENRGMKEVLRWYSNMRKVCESEHLDGGKRAIAALSHLKG